MNTRDKAVENMLLSGTANVDSNNSRPGHLERVDKLATAGSKLMGEVAETVSH